MNLVFAFILLAASPSPNAHPIWMVGEWGWQNPDETEADCKGDHTAIYHRNGRYDFMDETGTWRVEGDRLIETTTDPGEAGDPAQKGKSFVRRFERIKPGVLQIFGEYPGKLIKCAND